jgi:hypothetical protein
MQSFSMLKQVVHIVTSAFQCRTVPVLTCVSGHKMETVERESAPRDVTRSVSAVWVRGPVTPRSAAR